MKVKICLITARLEEATILLARLEQDFSVINGIKKLEKRISAELKFLQKLQDHGPSLKKEHILSSNLSSLAAVVDILAKSTNPIAVLKPFNVFYPPKNRIEVDVVSDGGATWYKAIARKAEALDDISKGRSSCGQKSVLHQAKIYLNCAREHLHHFRQPQVVFCFFNGIGVSLASKLRKMGIQVEGNLIALDESHPVIEDSEDEESDVGEETTSEDEEISADLELPPPVAPPTVHQDKLFLDITCMVAYVSSMTNGGAGFRFPKAIYNQQGEWERKRPAKSLLDALFAGKQLVTCLEALNDFEGLVNRMGGPGELKRTAELRRRLLVVDNDPSDRVIHLQLTSNIKERSRIIFGTADQLGISIVTANTGFIRSASSQGVDIAYYEHEPRVLTEQQEAFSMPLSDSPTLSD
nr:EOG090X0CWG [Macrothrix elegans]